MTQTNKLNDTIIKSEGNEEAMNNENRWKPLEYAARMKREGKFLLITYRQ